MTGAGYKRNTNFPPFPRIFIFLKQNSLVHWFQYRQFYSPLSVIVQGIWLISCCYSFSCIGIINESYKLGKVVVGHAAAAWLSSSRNCQSQEEKRSEKTMLLPRLYGTVLHTLPILPSFSCRIPNVDCFCVIARLHC